MHTIVLLISLLFAPFGFGGMAHADTSIHTTITATTNTGGTRGGNDARHGSTSQSVRITTIVDGVVAEDVHEYSSSTNVFVTTNTTAGGTRTPYTTTTISHAPKKAPQRASTSTTSISGAQTARAHNTNQQNVHYELTFTNFITSISHTFAYVISKLFTLFH